MQFYPGMWVYVDMSRKNFFLSVYKKDHSYILFVYTYVTLRMYIVYCVYMTCDLILCTLF